MVTVLIVDDSPTQRARWLYSLSDADTTVVSDDRPLGTSSAKHVVKLVTAKSGEHAVARLRTHDVDVLVTDVEMPGMSGWQLALAAQAMSAKLVVIVFSSKVETGHNQVPELDPLRTHVISKTDREQAVGIVRRLLSSV